MQLLSDDDQNLRGMTMAELEAAWDLWFELAQHTNDFDPPYTHGVFQTVDLAALADAAPPREVAPTAPTEAAPQRRPVDGR